MKNLFSKKWKSSKQARKQRKYLMNMPLHLRHKIMSANLSKELRKKYNRRSFPIRKGDIVKIIDGSFKGKVGKINKVDLKKTRVSIEGIQKQKKDGTKINVYFYPSKLQIIELNLDDKERIKAITKQKEKNIGEKDDTLKKK